MPSTAAKSAAEGECTSQPFHGAYNGGNAASELSPVGSPVVPGALPRAYGSPAARLAGDPGPAGHAHRGPDRVGQDAGGVPGQPRPPLVPRPGGRVTRSNLRRVRVSSEGLVE